jgi:hypothetical protein
LVDALEGCHPHHSGTPREDGLFFDVTALVIHYENRLSIAAVFGSAREKKTAEKRVIP